MKIERIEFIEPEDMLGVSEVGHDTWNIYPFLWKGTGAKVEKVRCSRVSFREYFVNIRKWKIGKVDTFESYAAFPFLRLEEVEDVFGRGRTLTPPVSFTITGTLYIQHRDRFAGLEERWDQGNVAQLVERVLSGQPVRLRPTRWSVYLPEYDETLHNMDILYPCAYDCDSGDFRFMCRGSYVTLSSSRFTLLDEGEK